MRIRKPRAFIATLAMATMFVVLPAAPALAADPVPEVEPNDSIATAQNVDGESWNLNYSPDIGDTSSNTSTTIPHISILGTGNNTFDYYSFTVAAGSFGIFDIDYGETYGPGSVDTWLHLFDSSGVLLASDDDSSTSWGAGGSVDSYDSYIEYTFASAGTYVIRVREYFDYPVPAGATYTLQVSLDGRGLDQPPVADANGPYSVQFNESILLDGTGSYDFEGPLTYLWSVTGGSLDDPTLAQPTYTAPYEPGTYVATLTVTDTAGATDTTTGVIIVFDPIVYSPWTGPGVRSNGVCEILMWWDNAHVVADTDGDLDEWSVRGAARFYDYDVTRDREVSLTSSTSFDGDASTSVVLEEQWRTDSWQQFVGIVRLDDISLVVFEDDGRAGDDKGTMSVSPNELIYCGDTVSMTLTVPVDPLGLRGRPTTKDASGLISIDLTITTVPVTYRPFFR
ncbi:MAG: hypothetical protein HKN01_08795 [Acidimicrobiia bacterium]|nr:hypothetical protein [Acidimicrobiia bacterium]